MKRIYILGESRGTYRVQYFAKTFMDRWKQYKIYYENMFYANRILRYLKSFFINFWVILRCNVVYVCTLNVDINIFWELFWAWLFRKKIIVDFYVSVYDTVVMDRKWFKEGSFLASLARLCDKLFFRFATVGVFLSEAELAYYAEIVGKTPDQVRHVLIPLCNEDKPLIHSEFVFGEKRELCVCWWGSYLPLHGLETILNAAKLVKDKGLPVTWHFFGNDPQKGHPYEQQASDLDLRDVCFFENSFTFQNGKLPEFLQKNCDIALGVFGLSRKSVTVLINKVLDGCSMGVTTLTGESLGFREHFDPGDSLFLCQRTPEALAAAVEQIYHADKEELRNRITRTSAVYNQDFSVSRYSENLLNLVDSL